MSSKYNPKNIDYNKDGEVDGWDDQFAVKDYNKDGKVNDKEEERFRKERDETKTEYKYNDKGELVESKIKGSGKEMPPEPAMDFSVYTEKFLKKHPAVAELIQTAIKYNWTEEQFIRNVEETAWGQSTTDAEAAFDLQITGSNAEALTDPQTGLIPLKRAAIKKQAEAAGVSLTDKQLDTFARNAVRSALDEDAVNAWIAGKFVIPEEGGGKPTKPPKPITGTAAQIAQQLRDMADSYGLPVTNEYLQDKVRQGLEAEDWQSWVEGQRATMQQQAKLAYPTVADQFDSYTLDELMTPYLAAATQMFGTPKAQMKLNDPMWNAALKGPDGRPMSMDDWIKTLRTDSKYGYTKTVAAKQEASDLASGIIRAFGMA